MSEVGMAGRVAPSGARTQLNQDVTADIVGPVPAAGSLDATLAVPGLSVGDRALVQCPTLEAGLSVQALGCTVADTLAVRFSNPTAAPIEPASHVYQITMFKLIRTL
jgi:hypothetical protein